MDIAVFEEFGLTPAETQVYLALIDLGQSKAGPIIERSGLQTSVVHRALNSLIDKSLIGFVLKGKHRVYEGIDPERFLDFIEDKRRRFEKILPELKARAEQSMPERSIVVYEGVRGIREAYYAMIDSDGTEYLTFGGGPPTTKVMGLPFWLNLHRRRVDAKLPSRQVFDASVRRKGGTRIEALGRTDIRYLPAEFAQLQETVIVGDHVLIAVFTERPYATLIHDEAVADGYRKHFERLWESAEKP